MIASFIARTTFAAVLSCMAFAPSAFAQAAKQPSLAALGMAREIIEAKGALGMFDSVINGVVEYHKGVMLQSNPLLQKDLDDVAARLRTEFAPRVKDVQGQVVLGYATRFTEPELKEILAFYRTPIGKKLITEEPAAVDDATKRVDVWASKFAEEVLVRMRAEMKKKGHSP
jgi:hypothetical protein